MTPSAAKFVDKYVERNPNEDPEETTKNLVSRFSGKYKYDRVLEEVLRCRSARQLGVPSEIWG